MAPSTKKVALQALRRILSERPEAASYPLGSDDRTIAIVSATLLEHALEDAIIRRLVGDKDLLRRKLFSGDNEREGFLGSVSAKAWLAYGLGLIGDNTRDDLNNIRAIRNVFAHAAVHVTFQSEGIAELCDFHVNGIFVRNISANTKTDNKAQFCMACDLIGYGLKWVSEHSEDDPDYLTLRGFLA